MIQILIGFISGIVSGTGMGGGTILILLLSMFFGVEQHIAQATNLVFFVPTSIVAIFMNIKNKTINLRLAVTITIFGVIGAVVGAIVSSKLDVQNLKKCFGIFIGLVALHEIYSILKVYIKKQKRYNNKE